MSLLEEEAQGAEDAGNLASAHDLWLKLANDTRDPYFFCRAGRAAEKLLRWHDAETAFRQALKLDPMLVEAMQCLGSLFLTRNDGAEAERLLQAEELLQRALKVDRNAGLLTLLGVTFAAQGDEKAARKALNDAVLLDPGYEEAYYNLALLAQNRDPEEARRLLEKAIELDSDYATAHQKLGILLQKTGDVLQAEYHFRRCLEIDAADYWSHLYLANALAIQGRDDEAEREYRHAIALRPTESAGLSFFADFLDELSRDAEAAQFRARAQTSAAR